MENQTGEISVRSGIADMENLVGILVKSGYEVISKTVMKEFPLEKNIDYFKVIYKK